MAQENEQEPTVEETWQAPVVEGLGWTNPSLEELKDAAQKTAFEKELEDDRTGS